MTETNKANKIVEGDSDYKFGVIYFNTTDPRIVVPKKHGMGWTFNLGHPAGQLATVATVGLIFAPILMKSHHRKNDKAALVKKQLKKIKKLTKK